MKKTPDVVSANSPEFSTDRGTTPSISVGNLSFGGRGKTPLVAAIARHLLANGERPAVLSRGYARRRPEDGATVVSDGTHILADLDRAGDEPLMLARTVAGAIVVVCDVRRVAAAIARKLGATVLVLDDGFQHRQMRRDVDIVSIAAEDLTDRRAPFGRLREPVSALARAHAVIIDGPPGPRPPVPAHVQVFGLRRTIRSPMSLEPDRPWPAGRGPVVALAGIARPERLRRTLESDGWTVARLVAYPDHHPYRRRDLEAIGRAVAETRARGVLTTEKDAVRLLPLRPLPCPIAAVPLEVSVEPEPEFHAWLDARIRGARA